MTWPRNRGRSHSLATRPRPIRPRLWSPLPRRLATRKPWLCSSLPSLGNMHTIPSTGFILAGRFPRLATSALPLTSVSAPCLPRDWSPTPTAHRRLPSPPLKLATPYLVFVQPPSASSPVAYFRWIIHIDLVNYSPPSIRGHQLVQSYSTRTPGGSHLCAPFVMYFNGSADMKKRPC